MNFHYIFNDMHDNWSAIIFLQNANIIHKTRTYDNEHGSTMRGRWQCHIRSCRAEKGVETKNWIQSSKVRFPTFQVPTFVHFIYGWAHELTSVDFCKREFEMR